MQAIDPQAPPPAANTEEQEKAEQQAAADINAKQAKGGRIKVLPRARPEVRVGAVADEMIILIKGLVNAVTGHQVNFRGRGVHSENC
jgi:hypothetical protein